MPNSALDALGINTIRTLAVDAVERAGSGHPGTPMGAAAIAYAVWTRFLRHNPANPNWPNRDRFVLSPGHASVLLSRDGAYHQGTVWAWLIGAFADAHRRVYDDPAAVRSMLRPFEDHLHEAGLGAVSEIFDGDAPHIPRGSIAQAWSVAELLRTYRTLVANQHDASPPTGSVAQRTRRGHA